MDPVITPTTATTIAGLIELITANIDNPTELNAIGTAVEDLRLVHENVAGSDRATLYRLDTSNATVSAPWVMASVTGSLRWTAIAGYAVNQAMRIANALSVLDATDHTKIITWDLTGLTTSVTLTLKPTSSTTQILQYPNITATDTLAVLGLAQNFSAAQTVTAASPQFTLTGASGVNIQQNLTAVGAAGATIAMSAGAANQCLLTYSFGGTSYMQFGGNATTPFLLFDSKNSYQTYDYQQAAASVAIHTFRATTDATSIGSAGLCTTGGMSVAKTLLVGGSTNATSTATGCAQFTGGAVVTKNIIHAQGRGAGFATNATIAGTITLTNTSKEIQTFTGSTAATVIQFPAANLFGAGISVLFTINNQSTQTVTPTRAGADTFQGGGTTDPVTTGATTRYASDGVSLWMKI